MANINFSRYTLISVFVFLLLPVWPIGAWGHHEKIPCTACHDKTAEALKGYVHDRAAFPVSDRCLACHDGSMDVSGLNPPHVINGNKELAGGSFTPTTISAKVGHNILSVDPVLGLTPPGGASLDNFGCLSCHDAHENGNFRNLKKTTNGHSTPVEGDSGPDFQKNVYISGMNNFCGACHSGFNGGRSARGVRGWRSHPVGISISGAGHADFEKWSRLTDRVTQAEYPSGNPDDIYSARVFCLSCHRAHASPNNNALRWDYSRNAKGCLECHAF